MREPISNEPLSVTLSYQDALRLSYMARFPWPKKRDDERIAEAVDQAIKAWEAEYGS